MKGYNDVMNTYDVKKLMKKNTRPNENPGKVKRLFKDLEYIAFGAYSPKELRTIPEESEKLDIATGGEDMPPLETKEEAEKKTKRTRIKNNDTIPINN